MPSRAEVRSRVELACRGAALLALGALVWRAWHPPLSPALVLRVPRTADLPTALSAALFSTPAGVEATLDSVPGAAVRAWLFALSRSGSVVSWRAAATLGASSATVEPLPEPSGRVRLTVVGAPGTSASVHDAAGIVDSAKLGTTGVRVLDATLNGTVRVNLSGAAVTTAPRDSLRLRSVLVLARAGWEGKFVVAALEESGWRVDARLTVAPNAVVEQGTLLGLDTARYSAAVALDETAAALAPALIRFARSGGGVIIAPAAARIPALATLLPARLGDTLPAVLGALASESPRRGLPAVALRPTSRDAVVLERRSGAAVTVASRVALGRVLLVGFEDTWRWRMEGSDASPAEHRAWWSGLVSAVAYAPSGRRAVVPNVDEAPYAALVAAVGTAAASAFASTPPLLRAWWDRMLFALLLAGLLTEWSSRRLRGAK